MNRLQKSDFHFCLHAFKLRLEGFACVHGKRQSQANVTALEMNVETLYNFIIVNIAIATTLVTGTMRTTITTLIIN